MGYTHDPLTASSRFWSTSCHWALRSATWSAADRRPCSCRACAFALDRRPCVCSLSPFATPFRAMLDSVPWRSPPPRHHRHHRSHCCPRYRSYMWAVARRQVRCAWAQAAHSHHATWTRAVVCWCCRRSCPQLPAQSGRDCAASRSWTSMWANSWCERVWALYRWASPRRPVRVNNWDSLPAAERRPAPRARAARQTHQRPHTRWAMTPASVSVPVDRHPWQRSTVDRSSLKPIDVRWRRPVAGQWSPLLILFLSLKNSLCPMHELH